MPSLLTRAVLFLSGYIPLFLIFSVQYYPSYQYWALIPLGIGVFAGVGLFGFLLWVKNSAARELTISSVQRRDSEVIAYIFAYVFPFLGLDIENFAGAIGLGIFFVVLMILNVSSNMIHINPVLNLIGYHVYDVEVEGTDSHTLITRRGRLVKGTSLRSVVIGDSLLMEK